MWCKSNMRSIQDKGRNPLPLWIPVIQIYLIKDWSILTASLSSIHCYLNIYLSDFTRIELSKQSTMVPFVLANQTFTYLCSNEKGSGQ